MRPQLADSFSIPELLVDGGCCFLGSQLGYLLPFFILVARYFLASSSFANQTVEYVPNPSLWTMRYRSFSHTPMEVLDDYRPGGIARAFQRR